MLFVNELERNSSRRYLCCRFFSVSENLHRIIFRWQTARTHVMAIALWNRAASTAQKHVRNANLQRVSSRMTFTITCCSTLQRFTGENIFLNEKVKTVGRCRLHGRHSFTVAFAKSNTCRNNNRIVFARIAHFIRCFAMSMQSARCMDNRTWTMSILIRHCWIWNENILPVYFSNNVFVTQIKICERLLARFNCIPLEFSSIFFSHGFYRDCTRELCSAFIWKLIAEFLFIQ